LALANTAGVLTRAIEARYSVEVPAGAGNVEGLLSAVRSVPGVTSADAVPESEMRHTLERWLGPAAQSSDLPVPALVNFDVKPGADLGAIRHRVETTVPGATIAAHREAVGPLLRSLRLLQWVAFGLVLLLSAAASAAVVLAARGALDTHRFTIEVMHGIGATDEQVVRLFVRQIAVDALLGGMAGAAAAGLTIALIIGGAGTATMLAGAPPLGWNDAIWLLMLPLAIALLATQVARIALVRALRERL
jgi:cell division transport system permease protein